MEAEVLPTAQEVHVLHLQAFPIIISRLLPTCCDTLNAVLSDSHSLCPLWIQISKTPRFALND